MSASQLVQSHPSSRAILFSDAHRSISRHKEAQCLLHGQGQEPPTKGGDASRAPGRGSRARQPTLPRPHTAGTAKQNQEREENKSRTEGIWGVKGNTRQEGEADVANGN